MFGLNPQTPCRVHPVYEPGAVNKITNNKGNTILLLVSPSHVDTLFLISFFVFLFFKLLASSKLQSSQKTTAHLLTRKVKK